MSQEFATVASVNNLGVVSVGNDFLAETPGLYAIAREVQDMPEPLTILVLVL